MAANVEMDECRTAYADEDLLTPAMAATIARRSVRTIRRAYGNGALVAYRDANGRGVRIRYRDLRNWMLHEPVTVKPAESLATTRLAGPAVTAVRGGRNASLSENLALLHAAREARARRVRGGASARRAAAPAASSQA
jgi:hypothetical protein